MADVNIQLGYKSSAWFSSNSTLVLLEGQIVYKLQTGEYKIGDGVTQLSALSFLGAGSGSASWGGITGTLSNQTDLQTALDAKLNKSGSNADQDLDLGNFAVNAKSFKVNGTDGNGNVGLKHQASDATANGQETAIFAGSDGELYYKNDGNAVAQIASRAWVNLQGFITNVATALGYTPANKAGETFTGPITATNLSGTNTGDQNLTPYAKHNTFFSTQWVCQPGSGVYAQLTALHGIIWFVPFKVDHDTVFTDIGMEVVVAAASSNINLALYNDNGTGQGPGTKIEESGNLSAATTGLKSYTFSPSPRTLLASSKIYWLAFQVSSATIALRYNQMISVVIPSTGAGTSLKTLSQAYGTFPASGSTAAFNTSSNNFKIMLKPQ